MDEDCQINVILYGALLYYITKPQGPSQINPLTGSLYFYLDPP